MRTNIEIEDKLMAAAINQELLREVGTLRQRCATQLSARRDLFVAAALQGLLSGAASERSRSDEIVRDAVAFADAILEEIGPLR